jgi:hypothetical protein
MIEVEIVGQIKNKKLVHTMCYDILDELLPRIKRQVEITINIITSCDGQESGYCLGDKNGVTIDVARETSGYKLPYDEIVLTLCHELVHAKQFIKGELTEDLKWMGKSLRHLPIKDHPWEHEAYNLEKILYNKYAKGIL